ncbi:hypothetical protein KJA15_04080 [Patescibacteria group bacterium]|nr:hypothetical protein [Patescibacteria group bacterium]
MDSQNRVSQFAETLILAIILLAGMGLFFWKAGFFEEQKPPQCDKYNIELCDTQELCESSNLYWWDNACHTTGKVSPAPSEYPDYEGLKDITSLVLLEKNESWVPEGKKENIIGYTKNLESKGRFSRIYLYAEVSVNSKPLTQYESLYVKFNYTGGHLFRPQSLKIPPNTITRLLYAINNVSYLATIPYSESKTPLTVNWFEFFKDNSLIRFDVFISSLKPATIDNILLYYDCAEGSECKIEILE